MNTKDLNLSKTKGFIFVLLAVLFWGVSFVSTKVVLREYPPVSIAFIRQLVAIIPLMLLMKKNNMFVSLSFKKGLHFMIASLFGIVLYFVFENTGLLYTTASCAALIVATVPVFTIIVEAVIYKVKINFANFILIIVSLVGVYLVISENGKVSFEGGLKGNLLVLAAMASWIIYTIITKQLGKSYSSLQMTSIQTLLSIPLFIPFIIGDISMWKVPSLVALLNIIFLGVFCSALAYVFFLYGIQSLGPSIASAYLNLIPVVTIILSISFLGESLSLFQIIGSVLIILSLSLIKR